MTKEERASTMQLLTLAHKTFPYSKADAETFTLYIAALDDLTFAQIRAGVLKCMNTAKFFPTIAEIREAAEQMTDHANGNDKPDAGAAWGEVMKFIMRRGPYDDRPFPWSCEEVHEAVKRIGAMTLFEMENDDVPTVRAQFRQIYQGVLRDKKERKTMDMIGRRLGKDFTALIENTAKKLEIDGGDKPMKGAI